MSGRCSLNRSRPIILSAFVLIAMGCAMVEPKETAYLRTAQDRATQEEVRQRLGPPTLTAATQTGEALWVYQIRTQQPGNRMTAPGMWCDEYVLTFDDHAVLRRDAPVLFSWRRIRADLLRARWLSSDTVKQEFVSLRLTLVDLLQLKSNGCPAPPPDPPS